LRKKDVSSTNVLWGFDSSGGLAAHKRHAPFVLLSQDNDTKESTICSCVPASDVKKTALSAEMNKESLCASGGSGNEITQRLEGKIRFH
jgi:hypothetical protein